MPSENGGSSRRPIYYATIQGEGANGWLMRTGYPKVERLVAGGGSDFRDRKGFERLNLRRWVGVGAGKGSSSG
jgi:hypothetical protein